VPQRFALPVGEADLAAFTHVVLEGGPQLGGDLGVDEEVVHEDGEGIADAMRYA